MIQVEVFDATSNSEALQNAINGWIKDTFQDEIQILDIQYVMGSEYGSRSAMIIYDDKPEPTAFYAGEAIRYAPGLPSKR